MADDATQTDGEAEPHQFLILNILAKSAEMDIHEIDNEAHEGAEVLLETIPDELKCLHAYLVKLREETRELVAEHEAVCNDMEIGRREILERCDKIEAECAELKHLHQYTSTIFWYEVRGLIPAERRDEKLELCSGFKVVVHDQQCTMRVINIHDVRGFGDMFGDDGDAPQSAAQAFIGRLFSRHR